MSGSRLNLLLRERRHAAAAVTAVDAVVVRDDSFTVADGRGDGKDPDEGDHVMSVCCGEKMVNERRVETSECILLLLLSLTHTLTLSLTRMNAESEHTDRRTGADRTTGRVNGGKLALALIFPSTSQAHSLHPLSSFLLRHHSLPLSLPLRRISIQPDSFLFVERKFNKSIPDICIR